MNCECLNRRYQTTIIKVITDRYIGIYYNQRQIDLTLIRVALLTPLEVECASSLKFLDEKVGQAEVLGVRTLLRITQEFQRARADLLKDDQILSESAPMSVQDDTIHINLDATIGGVYTVGFLAYLIGDSDGSDIEMDSLKVEGRKVFKFIFNNLEEYKRMFIYQCLEGTVSVIGMEKLKF
jgi:hypothetical protein